MKTLKLLNKKNFFLIFFLFSSSISFAEEKPVDIWDIDKKKIDDTSLSNQSLIENNKIKTSPEFEILNIQNKKKNDSIVLDNNIDSNEIKIFGLYDPKKYSLDINMWSNSDGDQLKNIFLKMKKINFSKDANEIIKIALLTNAYSPKNNITEKEFLNFKTEWLIKNSDLN